MNLATPEDAQRAFYEAFTARDLDAMMQVWSTREDITCIHPGSEALTGQKAIRQSWELILGQGETLRVQSTPVQDFVTDELVTLIVTEHIYIESRDIRGETLATNVFRLEHGDWRMTLHHGSPKPVEPTTNPSESEPPAQVH